MTRVRASGRQLTALLLLLGSILLALAAVVGMDDNPVGIALAYTGAWPVVLAFVHGWRTPRPFLRLMAGAVIAFVLLVVIHNLAYGVGHAGGSPVPVRLTFSAVSAGAFLLAVLFCPATFVVGAAGALAARLRGTG